MRDFPGGASGKEPTWQRRRRKKHGFDLWVGKILRRRAWQPTPICLPWECMNRGDWWATVHGVAKSRTCTHSIALWFPNPSYWDIHAMAHVCVLFPAMILRILSVANRKELSPPQWETCCHFWLLCLVLIPVDMFSLMWIQIWLLKIWQRIKYKFNCP